MAHLGYFRKEFVENRQWLDDRSFTEIVSLCQFLPGPASSQVGMCIGLLRAGFTGALLAWTGFTLPSATALTWTAIHLPQLASTLSFNWLHGLKLVAVAVVAQALWGMVKAHCKDGERILLSLICAIIFLFFTNSLIQLVVILCSAGYGLRYLHEPHHPDSHLPMVSFNKKIGAALLLILAALIFILPLLGARINNYPLSLFSAFFQTGALVFGGGHVVLPMLQAQVVPTGWMSNDIFLAGYGLAQAVPGPLFTLAAYLGAVSNLSPSGWAGSALATFAIFLPSFLLVFGITPFWSTLRSNQRIQNALLGINASVVGMLFAALINPVITSAIFSIPDAITALLLYVALQKRIPAWVVVMVGFWV